MAPDDRTLLKRAAKAAGYVVKGFFEDEASLIVKLLPGYPPAKWNPLTNDGDALRLAVKLRLHLGLEDEAASAWKPTSRKDGFSSEATADDPYAATRRAIVRAAASMAGE